MNRMTKGDLHDMHPAVVTPFDAAGNIVAEAFRELVEFLIGLGATGICVAGDNGEGWALAAEERGRLVRLAHEQAHGRVRISCGCSAPTAREALAHACAARDNGADALLSMPPTYVLKGSRTEILNRFEQLGRHVALPVIVYNSPRRHGYSLSVSDIEAVMGVADVIGLKESSRDFFHHAEVLHALSGRLAVMTGPCHYILPSLRLGAAGFIATGPEFLASQAADIRRLAMAEASASANAVHHKLAAIYRLLMETGTWPAAFKAALNLIGLPAGLPRDPVRELEGTELARIRHGLQALDIDCVS
jgi:4-hydroxy-tetrahydrodipicolinate synthase